MYVRWACLMFSLSLTTAAVGAAYSAGWSTSSCVWRSSQDSLSPSVSVDGNGASHTAWYERSAGSYNQIHYTNNTDGWFFSPEIISQGGSQHCYWPIVRADGGTIHASWTRQEPGEDAFEIYYRRNSGSGWGPFYNASNTAVKSIRQSMAVRGSVGPVVCWDEALYGADNYDILFSEWTGSSFTAARNISETPGGTVYGSVKSNAAVCPNSDIVAVWADRISGEYRVNARRRVGGIWQTRQELSNLEVGPQKPGLAVGPDNQVHVAYSSSSFYGVSMLYYQRWNGSQWTNPELIPNQPGPQMLRAAVAVDEDGVVHIVADNDYQGSGEIYHITNTNGAWSVWTNISGTTGTSSLNADISFAAGVLAAVWQDNSDGAGGKGVYQVYHASLRYEPSPQPVRSLSIVASDGANRIYWSNPTSLPLWGTTIRCKTGSYPTGPLDGQMVCDKPAVPGGDDSFVHDGLVNGQTYYYAVYTHDNRGNYSSASYFQSTPQALACQQVKQYDNGRPVDLRGKVVTGIFGDENCIYVEEPNRSSGIRVAASGAGLSVGDKVDIAGLVGTRVLNNVAAERQIENASVMKTGSFPIKPLFLKCGSVGGGTLHNLSPGVRNGAGLNNVGLLVTIAGRATDVRGSYVYVDDGSKVENLYGLVTPEIGVMVKCPAAAPVQKGNFVRVTGVIAGSVPLGWTENRAFIQIRTMDDLQIAVAP